MHKASRVYVSVLMYCICEAEQVFGLMPTSSIFSIDDDCFHLIVLFILFVQKAFEKIIHVFIYIFMFSALFIFMDLQSSGKQWHPCTCLLFAIFSFQNDSTWAFIINSNQTRDKYSHFVTFENEKCDNWSGKLRATRIWFGTF